MKVYGPLFIRCVCLYIYIYARAGVCVFPIVHAYRWGYSL